MELMKITGYTDEKFSSPVNDPYSVMINPDTIKWQRSIDYNEQQTANPTTDPPKYKSTPNDKLNFDIVIDCTGIVDPKRTEMSKEINALNKILFLSNGKIHRPNFLMIQWGKAIMFKGVLTSFDTSFTLFKSNGSPLRAKISLAFSSCVPKKTAQKQDALESPDVSHRVTVKEGISLPQLCQDVWNDDSKYIQVAKYNHLNKFRNLEGIENLIFPPLV